MDGILSCQSLQLFSVAYIPPTGSVPIFQYCMLKTHFSVASSPAYMSSWEWAWGHGYFTSKSEYLGMGLGTSVCNTEYLGMGLRAWLLQYDTLSIWEWAWGQGYFLCYIEKLAGIMSQALEMRLLFLAWLGLGQY